MAEKSNGTMITYCYLIPVFNEEENLPLLKERIIGNLIGPNNFFLFVDDKSTDNSVEAIRRLFGELDHHVIEKSANKGPGDSFNQGFEFLVNKFQDQPNVRVITMEADNTSDISILSDMVNISNLGYDLVLASVYAQGGGFSQTSFVRKVLSFFANMLFRSFFNVKILTLSSFYRIYHLELLAKIKKQKANIITEKGFICMLEVLLKAIYCEAKIIEVPMVLESGMRKGKSKMKILKTSISYLKFMLKS